LDRRASDGTGLKKLRFPRLFLVLLVNVRLLNKDGLINDEWPDLFCSDQLRVAVVNYLVDYFVDKHKVLAYGFLIKHAAVVSEDLHHAVDDVVDHGRAHVMFRRRNEIDTELS